MKLKGDYKCDFLVKGFQGIQEWLRNITYKKLQEILRCSQIKRYFKLKYLLYLSAHRFFRHAQIAVTQQNILRVEILSRAACDQEWPLYLDRTRILSRICKPLNACIELNACEICRHVQWCILQLRNFIPKLDLNVPFL